MGSQAVREALDLTFTRTQFWRTSPMSDQAAAVETPGQPTNPSAGSATMTPEAIAKAAAAARRAAILAAYDILRPAGEVDSRGQRVLVSALVLIALCIVPEKPTAVSFEGVSFSLRHWLALAIPLCAIVLYLMAELIVAWRIQSKRVDLILKDSRESVLGLLYKQMGAILTRSAAFHYEKDIISAKRKEIWDWYEQRRDEIDAKYRALEEQERYPGEFFGERMRAYDALSKEREQRAEAAGITAFDQKVDEMFKTGFDQDAEVIRQNNEAIAEVRRIFQMKKIRLAMGLVLPALLSVFSLLTFAWAVVRAHHG
jgi:hypothetical protein